MGHIFRITVYFRLGWGKKFRETRLFSIWTRWTLKGSRLLRYLYIFLPSLQMVTRTSILFLSVFVVFYDLLPYHYGYIIQVSYLFCGHSTILLRETNWMSRELLRRCGRPNSKDNVLQKDARRTVLSPWSAILFLHTSMERNKWKIREGSQ
jgi:hypothetical protein